MKILSVRRGLLADHSSTSYEFLAVDKPLGARARAAVARLSSRARPTRRRVRFIYHADGYDIPGGWEPLLFKHYDVMYSESYDWWTLAVAFDTDNKALLSKLTRYAFVGADDMGVQVRRKKGRALVTIRCRLDTGVWDPSGWDDPYDDEEGEEGDDEVDGVAVATGNSLLHLLARVRSCLMRGWFEPLYAVWQEYGEEDDEDETTGPAPPKPRKNVKGKAVAAELAAMLDRL